MLPALCERVQTEAGPGGYQINEEVRSILHVTLQGYMRQDRRTPVWGNLHNGNRDRLDSTEGIESFTPTSPITHHYVFDTVVVFERF